MKIQKLDSNRKRREETLIKKVINLSVSRNNNGNLSQDCSGNYMTCKVLRIVNDTK